MSGRMFNSGGSGYSVEGGYTGGRSIAEIEAEKKDIENQKSLRRHRFYQKEKENYYRAIGKEPHGSDKYYAHFRAEIRKKKDGGKLQNQS